MGHTDRAALIAWVKDEASDCRASNASAARFDAIAALLEADGKLRDDVSVLLRTYENEPDHGCRRCVGDAVIVGAAIPSGWQCAYHCIVEELTLPAPPVTEAP